MVAHQDPDVKSDEAPRPPPDDSCLGLRERLIRWIDCHPRTGWYLCIIATLNLLLNLLDLFH